MLVVGLTGNIGCGKSSLSDIFRAEGIKIIDADIIARQIYEDEKLLSKVYETFGNDIKNEDGSLNRKALGRIVFSDDEKLIQLNKLTHPVIRQKVSDEIEEYKSQNEEIVILDAALLVESDYLNFIDKLLVVTCKENIQIERIIARDNCSIEEALGRIKSQMSQENKVKYADYVIDNSATLSELRKKAFIFMNYIKEKWRE
ncbi:MAG: dephospho-CoA kinase [Clostridiales bacterium]|uniref:dephospho-CoA kinase n=1 Tax=Terrisporobacter sp. TaxID=1965305 RepID=UPI002A413D4C|nr:dephospho-CoA kinase [Terrisporobacter sp.]MCI6458140.1 dephospho-CoA kinase [Clostridium sp.]MDD5877704.1 dephospho-CoA kinase [Clostridiales bacterium]MDD7755110.1 dephospho-CoA kinase [Clostridiales bacterium]MDY4136411.1 dephospho-CoA kinase [Terrisporobacter sp.]